MISPSHLAVALIEDLSLRMSTATAPSWPIPIFEAERSLYPRFLRRMLTAFDAVASQSGTHSVAAHLRTPTRVAELCYLLIGVSESDLIAAERLRLATHLSTSLSHLRPRDPLCRSGHNLLNNVAPIWDYEAEFGARAPIPAFMWAEPKTVNAALLMLAEFLNVGIPQYGREIHGPYPLTNGTYVLVRAHIDLRLPEVWPDTADFPWDEVHVVERRTGSGASIRFDLTNHSIGAPLSLPPVETRIVGVRGGDRIAVEDSRALLRSTLLVLDRLRRTTRSFGAEMWLRKHLEVRHRCLRSLWTAAGLDWRPTVKEYGELENSRGSRSSELPSLPESKLARGLLNECGLVAPSR